MTDTSSYPSLSSVGVTAGFNLPPDNGSYQGDSGQADSGTTDPAPRAGRGRTAGWASLLRRWLQRFGYVLVCAALGLVSFVVIVVLLAVGFPLVILAAGIVLVALCFGLARGYAELQRRLLGWLGYPMPALPPLPRTKGFWATLAGQVRNPDRWREVGLATIGALTQFTLSLTAASWFVGAWLTLQGKKTEGAFTWTITLFPHWVIGDRTLDFVIRVLALVLSPFLIWWAAQADMAIARAFLKPSRAALATRISQLDATRADAWSAEAASLRQIERDLHDGPQQRLIRTGMDLGLVQRYLAAGDIAAAQSLLAEAQARNDETIREIRALARGFAPPILTERGLTAALTSLAGGGGVAIQADLGVGAARYSPTVERTIYFGAAEAIANAAKYARSARVKLSLREIPAADGGRELVLQVSDAGSGGAQILPGHGLDGLRARVASVEGSLDVISPPGGGTTIKIAVPLA